MGFHGGKSEYRCVQDLRYQRRTSCTSQIVRDKRAWLSGRKNDVAMPIVDRVMRTIFALQIPPLRAEVE